MRDVEKDAMERFLSVRIARGMAFLSAAPKSGAARETTRSALAVFEPAVADIGDDEESEGVQYGTLSEEAKRSFDGEQDEGEYIHLSVPLMRRKQKIICDIVDAGNRQQEEVHDGDRTIMRILYGHVPEGSPPENNEEDPA